MKEFIVNIAKEIAEDLGIGYDKVLHFAVVFIATLIMMFLFGWFSGFVAYMALSFGKELYDRAQPGNHFCWYDIIADTLGFIVAILIYLLWTAA